MMSRSLDSMDCAVRMIRPGRSAIRHPVGTVSTGMSISRAAVRPMRSAPGPRFGSSGRNGKSGSSSTTIRTAAAGSVPGSDPVPVPLPTAQGKVFWPGPRSVPWSPLLPFSVTLPSLEPRGDVPEDLRRGRRSARSTDQDLARDPDVGRERGRLDFSFNGPVQLRVRVRMVVDDLVEEPGRADQGAHAGRGGQSRLERRRLSQPEGVANGGPEHAVAV